ncbi:MAG TPA: hypothetical protein VHP63_00230 [candidate division Zixibacteria bacterium]|nr:hypothetical protein [candidate division Zixibacteria bacterium]
MKNTRTLVKSTTGYTIIELLIAAIITAIITAASFGFYTSMHRQSEVQIDVSEIQHLCRASLFDIRKTLHMAGNRLGSSQVPYQIKGDTLAVYFSETKPVDTVKYYLTEFSAADYAKVPNLPAGQKVYRLMKKRNSAAASVFADFINDVNFVVIDPTSIALTITAQSSHQDESLQTNNGYRTFSLGERVNLRYLQLL